MRVVRSPPAPLPVRTAQVRIGETICLLACTAGASLSLRRCEEGLPFSELLRARGTKEIDLQTFLPLAKVSSLALSFSFCACQRSQRSNRKTENTRTSTSTHTHKSPQANTYTHTQTPKQSQLSGQLNGSETDRSIVNKIIPFLPLACT